MKRRGGKRNWKNMGGNEKRKGGRLGDELIMMIGKGGGRLLEGGWEVVAPVCPPTNCLVSFFSLSISIFCVVLDWSYVLSLLFTGLFIKQQSSFCSVVVDNCFYYYLIFIRRCNHYFIVPFVRLFSSSSFSGFCYRRGIGRPISRPLRILNSILYFPRFFQISQYAKVNARLFKCKDLTKQKKERRKEMEKTPRGWGRERKDLFPVFVHYSPDFLICFSFLFPLYLFWKIKKDYPSTLFLDLNGYFIDLNYSTWTFELSNLSLKLFFPASLTSFFLLPFLTSLPFPFVFDFLFYSLNSIFKTLWLTDPPLVFPFIYPVPVSRYPLCFSALLFTSFLLCLFHFLRTFFLSHFFLLPSFVFFFLSLVL